MAKVTENCYEATGHTTFLCDFSPPRSGLVGAVSSANLNANFLLANYNPGRAVRANSALLAAAIQQRTGRNLVFTLATRDMNRLALQSLLLGAQMLGLENVVVVRGDPFSAADLKLVKPVGDLLPTQLIASIAGMNRGQDFRDAPLDAPTDFCVGATVDLNRGLDPEARLTARKIRAGAQFLITQPIFDPRDASRFLESYLDSSGQPLAVPVFWGLAVPAAGGVVFSPVPESYQRQLDAGRNGVDLAIELFNRLQQAGLHNIYLVPPIRRGGVRDYDAAQQLLTTVNRI